jgi:urease accessory protein
MASHSHDHEDHGHSHDAQDHGHSHEILDGPGSFLGREMPIVEGRDFRERAFTVGIGGYVPSSTGCNTRILLTHYL